MSKINNAYKVCFLQAIACLVFFMMKGNIVWAILSGCILLIGLTPVINVYYYRFWDFIGKGAGKVNTYVVVGAFYVLILSPIGWIRRRFGKDPLQLQPATSSTYKSRDHTYKAKDLRDPW